MHYKYHPVIDDVFSVSATAATTLDEVTIDLLSSPVIEVAEGQDMEIHAAVTPSASDVIIKWNLAAGFLIDVRDNRFAALYNTTWNPRTGMAYTRNTFQSCTEMIMLKIELY